MGAQKLDFKMGESCGAYVCQSMHLKPQSEWQSLHVSLEGTVISKPLFKDSYCKSLDSPNPNPSQKQFYAY